jgi:hypothetical protein
MYEAKREKAAAAEEDERPADSHRLEGSKQSATRAQRAHGGYVGVAPVVATSARRESTMRCVKMPNEMRGHAQNKVGGACTKVSGHALACA